MLIAITQPGAPALVEGVTYKTLKRLYLFDVVAKDVLSLKIEAAKIVKLISIENIKCKKASQIFRNE